MSGRGAHSAPSGAPMSPAHAARLLKVSRRTVMRAIESFQLLAVRDNRNHWKINPEELDRWARSQCARSEHVHTKMPAHQDSAETLARLAAETARADAAERARDQAEADREAWRKQAEKLSECLQRRWWRW